MIILSVEYGDARTGIAVCDPLGLLASPVTVLCTGSAADIINKTAALAKEKQAQLIIVGYPKNMDGSEGFRAQAVKEFADELERTGGIPVKLWDERLTTVSAHKYLNEVNVRGKKRKQLVDAVSAVIILQSYLDSIKNQ